MNEDRRLRRQKGTLGKRSRRVSIYLAEHTEKQIQAIMRMTGIPTVSAAIDEAVEAWAREISGEES